MSVLHHLRINFPGLSPEWMKEVFLKSRELDAPWRALPDFLVIGAQKSGSTSLFNYLCLHPNVHGSFPKEIFYFSREFERGERWYRRHFPRQRYLKQSGMITGEGTTMYLCSSDAPGRAADSIPNVKLIAVLREPAARAVSHFNHRRRTGTETRGIDEVFSEDTICRWESGDELAKKDVEYFERGDYTAALGHWLTCFPRADLLVLEAEKMFADPSKTAAMVHLFLGLTPVRLHTTPAYNVSVKRSSHPVNFGILRKSFFEKNRKLAELGFPMSWTEPPSLGDPIGI